MKEQVNLKARWGVRKESVEACASHMLRCLQQLALCDEAFAHKWLKCGMSLKETLANKIELSAESLQSLLIRGRIKRDVDKSVIEHLGFSSGRLWNGREESAAHISIQCGAYPDPNKMPGINDVLLELPRDGSASERVFYIDNMRKIISTVLECWDPDWIRVSTYKLDEMVYPQELYQGQQVGWLTYVSDRYGKPPSLPREYEVSRVGNAGNLIVVSSIDRPTILNRAHVESLRKLSNILEQAGMLSPTPPMD